LRFQSFGVPLWFDREHLLQSFLLGDDLQVRKRFEINLISTPVIPMPVGIHKISHRFAGDVPDLSKDRSGCLRQAIGIENQDAFVSDNGNGIPAEPRTVWSSPEKVNTIADFLAAYFSIFGCETNGNRKQENEKRSFVDVHFFARYGSMLPGRINSIVTESPGIVTKR
jgi:hypothetical protein